MYPQLFSTSNILSTPACEGEAAQQQFYAEQDPTTYPEPSVTLHLFPTFPTSPQHPPPQPQLHYPPYHAPSHAYCQQLNNGMLQSYLRHSNEIQTLKNALQTLDSMCTEVLEHLNNHEGVEALCKEIDGAMQEHADDILAQSTLSGIMRESEVLRNDEMLLLQRVKSVWKGRREGDERLLEVIGSVRQSVRGLLAEEGLGE